MNVSPEKIKQLRAEHGWSQEQLGEVAGLSYRTVQRIEKDGNIYLGTTVAFLTMIYAAVIAELIIRPLKNKITYMLSFN